MTQRTDVKVVKAEIAVLEAELKKEVRNAQVCRTHLKGTTDKIDSLSARITALKGALKRLEGESNG